MPKIYIREEIADKEKIIQDIKTTAKEDGFNIDSGQTEFFSDMIDLMNDRSKNGEVTAIPAPCGIGKSLFIKHYTKWCAENGVGLIVITDNVERLDEQYALPEKVQKKIFMCRGETSIAAERKELLSYPVIMMTSQKYFGLDEDTKNSLFDFGDRLGHPLLRRRVIIDEQPIFFSSEIVGDAMLNEIDTLLRDGLDETVEEKLEIIGKFQECKCKLSKYIEKLENTYNYDVTFTANDNNFDDYGKAEFFKFIEAVNKHIGKLKAYNSKYAKHIGFLKLFYERGGFYFSNKKRGNFKYQKGIFVLKNNKEYFETENQQTNFFIFDATADAYPLYRMDFINIYNCDKYKNKLDLTIHFVRVSTSKRHLSKNKNELEAIPKYINREKKTQTPLILSYADYIPNFKTISDKTAYFGNIKGLNKYRDLTECFHIGINRLSPIIYFYIMCILYPEELEYVNGMNIDDSINFFRNITSNVNENELSEKERSIKERLNEILIGSVIADFDQNIFRLSVRKRNNEVHNDVCLLINYGIDIYADLAKRIYKRYFPRAEFDYIDTPEEIQQIKIVQRKSANGPTNVQKIINWLNSKPIGFKFDSKTLQKATGLTSKQIESAKKNSYLKEMLDKMKTDKKGVYRIVHR